MRTPKPLHLKLRVSGYLAGYLLLTHGLAGWAIFAVLPSSLAIIGGSGLICCAVYYWRRYISFSDPRAVSELKFVDNCWQVLRAGVRDFEAVEWRAVTILHYMVVLQFRCFGGKALNVVVLPDQLDPQSFRRLRVVAGFARLPQRQWFDFR